MDASLFASPYFGIALSTVAYLLGVRLQKKTGLVLCNPLIVAIVLVSAVLLIFRIPYESYDVGGAVINLFLAPATACLAVSIYTKAALLRQYWLAIAPPVPWLPWAACGSCAACLGWTKP